jgi:hypothetical protein
MSICLSREKEDGRKVACIAMEPLDAIIFFLDVII